MIETIVTPLKENFDMAVSLPAKYIGKEVHVLFFIEEEVDKTSATITPKKLPSDFFGILNKEEGQKFDQHIQQMRYE